MAQAGGCGAGGAGEPEPAELSLEAVLKAYEQPINEEQAWAVCFQGCRGLRGAPGSGRRIRDTADIVLRRDGSVGARPAEDEAGGAGDKEGAAGEWPAARLGVCARPGVLGARAARMHTLGCGRWRDRCPPKGFPSAGRTAHVCNLPAHLALPFLSRPFWGFPLAQPDPGFSHL